MHRDDQMNMGKLNLRGYRDNYGNIKRGFPVMKRNTVNHVEVLGNCCWELYERRQFRGNKEIISPGGNTVFPSFQPVSLKRIECTDK